MNAVRHTNGLLPAGPTIALIELLAKRSEGTLVESLVRDLAASDQISWARARNTISKLTEYGAISARSPVSQMISIGADAPHDWFTWIAERVAHDFLKLLSDRNAWYCVQYQPAQKTFLIDTMTLPIARDGLSLWLTEFGVAERDAIQTRFWKVAKDFVPILLSAAQSNNIKKTKRTKSAERLACELAQQAEQGEAAELWVLEYERQRLRDHPFRDQIRRISQVDVAAGYDILSFVSEASLQHDFFIEVKSHGTPKGFHWSRNEIATALELGENYALYLVDRTSCTKSGYKPHIITGPTLEMFSVKDSDWNVDPTTFELNYKPY